ncbi:hypothetical protein DEO72_LG7g889 [Vigna unguiculata]|uniref:Uncharacterized protein n=1 Tax=Vigna unguiculata TaxID=3917 RepID=A0A4D6ME21_VIGUN|nr:hypothetical protein DEO72_LG7g889 [Vigna unguiculata]
MSSISSSPSNSASQHHSFLADQDVLLTTFKHNWINKFYKSSFRMRIKISVKHSLVEKGEFMTTYYDSRASFSRSPSVRSPLDVRLPSAGCPRAAALFARRLHVVCTVSTHLRAPLASSAHRSRPPCTAASSAHHRVLRASFALRLCTVRGCHGDDSASLWTQPSQVSELYLTTFQ